MHVTQWTWHRSLGQDSLVALAVGIIAITAPYTAGSASAQSAAAMRSAGDGSRARAVAVVPFANISAHPADEWIGVGIAETVAADLGQFDLPIVGREAFAGVGRTSDPTLSDESATREWADALGVSWIVAGEFQRLGEQLVITARLVNVETGATTQTVTIDGAMDDMLALQDRIVTGLAESLQRIARGGPLDAPRLGVAAEAGALTGHLSIRPARARNAPTIDGRLDDAVWRDAARITEFVQMRPLDGAPATEDTEVYVAYDSTNIYLGFYAHYTNPDIFWANRVDRDRAERDDGFTVYFDTFFDQQRAYVFSVSGYGVQGDSILDAGGGFGGGGGRGQGGASAGGPLGDTSWDALFQTAGQRVEDGFTAEMAIPIKSLRYPQRGGDTPHRWGLQIVRVIRQKGEVDVWSPVTRDVAGFLPQMGVLDGMQRLSTSRNIELLPTFTAVQFGTLDDGTGDFATDAAPEGGLNFKYGVTSNLTADLTINPDFSQIESDRPQIAVNQRFNLFFPELRPFFIEGAEIFAVSQLPITVVHTRTIVDPLYGGKLTGKVGKTTVGVMYANDEAAGVAEDMLFPAASGQSAQTFVGRIRYDLYPESHIGAIFTDREFLDSHSRLVGIDGDFRLGDTHSLSFRMLGTQHRDLERLDTTGHLAGVFLRKSGRNLSYGVGSYMLSPDFETDVGFVRRTDQRTSAVNLSYQWWPETWLINWGPRLNYSRNHDFDDILNDETARAGINFQFAHNVGFTASANRDMERFGGVDFYKTRYRLNINVSTRLAGIGFGVNGGDQIFFDPDAPYRGYESGIFAVLGLRFVSRLRSEIHFTTNRFTDPRNNDALVFDVKIASAFTTYQFTDRLLLRNITEYNSFSKTFGMNYLVTYRINAGTVFYVGYDDRYQQGDRINEEFFPTTALQRTNQAIFTKLQYLFRF